MSDAERTRYKRYLEMLSDEEQIRPIQLMDMKGLAQRAKDQRDQQIAQITAGIGGIAAGVLLAFLGKAIYDWLKGE